MVDISVTADELLVDSYKIGKKVMLDEDFTPTYLIALWRGGTDVGKAVHEYLKFHNVDTKHTAIGTSGYNGGIDNRKRQVDVQDMSQILRTINGDDSLLILDDVYDTGLSICEFILELRKQARRNAPQKIKVGTVWYKPEKNLTERVPDYFIHQTDKWVMFPHELVGYTKEEIRECKGDKIADLLL
ncbi:hypoxanthine phosphoribosyltransferase [Candidatus Woesearchaeota archaeon]|nr:hypoxanthine phosphoribosyltransferase [Candidatus Woesearchaeota archaeon]